MAEHRPLLSADIPAALQLSTVAGWNQTTEDWQMLLDLEPRGCFTIDAVATTTLLRYGASLAWLGMVLTHPGHRGRGFAHRLLTAALQYADSLGVETVKLDATEQGLPIYRQFGFREELVIERWSHPPLHPQCAAPTSSDWDTALLLDREAYAVDRSRLLIAFQNRAKLYTQPGAFALLRPGSRANYLGPVIAHNPEAARQVVEMALSSCEGPCFWDLFPSNEDAVSIASAAGFMPVRHLFRMSRGKDLPRNTSRLYGIAGFEFG